MGNLKIKMRRNWWLGFLGFSLFNGFRYFQTGNWMDLLWFVSAVWFVWFIPVKRN